MSAEIHDIVAGAIFDFAGMVTSQPRPISSAHEAGFVVELITQWAEARGLSTDNPLVTDWQAQLRPEPALPETAPPHTDFQQSFDAREWAAAFMQRVETIPGFVNEGNMIGWFANALVRGYDEAMTRVRKALEEER